ncbi:hypothetical protein BCL69_100767 [Nitrosomonas communis]|uniref:Uncharacterized protein n=1 Tax=Nitrosomonas communis TaxID=44574 RepID=A0A5D3YES7_9PROT|nr:hypothetical protein BCL69_100767 [Nitrosomonas communis]
MFQSSPSSLAGRYDRDTSGGVEHGGFNPRPARWLGATPTVTFVAWPCFPVSILAQLVGWALPPDSSSNISPLSVSILAQLVGWALLKNSVFVMGTVQFQSSPSSLAGRYRLLLDVLFGTVWFQSSPSSLAGRYSLFGHLLPCSILSFNPRPARWLGATACESGIYRAS